MRMYNYPGRITKREARKRWDEGKSFIIVSCKYPPYRIYRSYAKACFGLAENAVRVNPIAFKSECPNFDVFCNAYEFYNCNLEVGRYAAFYLPEEELK